MDPLRGAYAEANSDRRSQPMFPFDMRPFSTTVTPFDQIRFDHVFKVSKNALKVTPLPFFDMGFSLRPKKSEISANVSLRYAGPFSTTVKLFDQIRFDHVFKVSKNALKMGRRSLFRHGSLRPTANQR